MVIIKGSDSKYIEIFGEVKDKFLCQWSAKYIGLSDGTLVSYYKDDADDPNWSIEVIISGTKFDGHDGNMVFLKKGIAWCIATENISQLKRYMAKAERETRNESLPVQRNSSPRR